MRPKRLAYEADLEGRPAGYVLRQLTRFHFAQVPPKKKERNPEHVGLDLDVLAQRQQNHRQQDAHG